ncbi:TPA: hypothetical protein RQN76_004438, partial [Aeromonas dhakensis]|nr:hypothetical protein [Aeromonas dhakensis]
QSDAEGAVLSAQFAKDLSEKYGLDADTVTLAAGLLASAATGLPIKGPKGGTGTSNVKESSGAENVVNQGALHSQLLAEEVSRGHAYQKHVVERKEFVDLGVTTQRQFQTFVESIVSNPSIDRRQSVDGTTYYLDHSTKTIVIRGQRGEATAFRPDQGGVGWDNYIKSQVPKK